MKKVVVTGGAGFIGSHLTEALVVSGYHVTVLDDLSAGKLDNIRGILPEIEFMEGSVNNFPLLGELFRGVDYVFHHAAIASVPQSLDDPRTIHDINATGTLNVLLASSENKVKRLIFASSSAVYGDDPVLPKKEDMTPCPLSPYAVSKLSGEQYCQVFAQVYNLPCVSLRYFNVYGPRQDPNSQYSAAIPKFISRTLADKPAVIFGDGEQTRDFTFVNDVVKANIMAVQSDVCGVFNVSCGISITVNELIGVITELTGKKLIPIHKEERLGDVRNSLADVSKAKFFGFETKYALEDGLRETVEWFSRR